MAAPRYLEKFESADAALTVTFPTERLEHQQAQGLRVPIALASGTHYGVDLLGGVHSPLQNGIETFRGVYNDQTDPTNIDDDLDDLKAVVHRAGLGKLFTIDSGSVRRWCWARAVKMPDIRVTNPFVVPVSVAFQRFSSWYGTTDYDQTFTNTTDPDDHTVSVTGNAQIFNAILILKGTYTNPVITNLTNGYQISSARDGAAASDWLKIDAGRHTIEFSINSGSTYADDWANYTRQSGQVQLMVFEPGDNTLRVAGGSTCSIDVDFPVAWY